MDQLQAALPADRAGSGSVRLRTSSQNSATPSCEKSWQHVIAAMHIVSRLLWCLRRAEQRGHNHGRELRAQGPELGSWQSKLHKGYATASDCGHETRQRVRMCVPGSASGKGPGRGGASPQAHDDSAHEDCFSFSSSRAAGKQIKVDT